MCAIVVALMAIVAIILGRRRWLRNQHKELKQPDYEQLVYGDAVDVAITKKKSEVFGHSSKFTCS